MIELVEKGHIKKYKATCPYCKAVFTYLKTDIPSYNRHLPCPYCEREISEPLIGKIVIGEKDE